VFVLVFALIVFGSFVSSLTASMTALRQLNQQSAGQFWLLRKFLRQHMISRDLALRVVRYLTHAVSRQREYIEESQVALLALLSTPLRDHLRKDLYTPSLIMHPFFECFGRLSSAVMYRVCGSALHTDHLSNGDVLFHHTINAGHMFFSDSGTMIYFPMRESSDPVDVEAGQFFCEAVLWTPWVHRGEMCAKTECCIISLDSAKFGVIVQDHPQEFALPKNYCGAFLRFLSEWSAQGGIVSDVHPCIRDSEEITAILGIQVKAVYAPSVSHTITTWNRAASRNQSCEPHSPESSRSCYSMQSEPKSLEDGGLEANEPVADTLLVLPPSGTTSL